MKDLISKLEDIRQYYLQPIIQRDKRGKERADTLTHTIEILKRIDDKETLANFLYKKLGVNFAYMKATRLYNYLRGEKHG